VFTAAPEKKTGQVTRSAIIGLTTDEAREKLEKSNITVDRVEQYEPSDAARNLARFAFPSNNVQQGSRVTLLEKDGVVHQLEVSSADTHELWAEMAHNRDFINENKEALAQASALQAELGSLRDELSKIQESHAAELAARDQELSELRASAKESSINVEEFQELRDQVRMLTTVVRVPAPAKDAAGPKQEKSRRERKPRNTEQSSGKEGKATEAQTADEAQQSRVDEPPDEGEPES
jgi:hypothetical protein